MTTANSFQGSIRYDHNVSKRVFIYGAFAGGYDELQQPLWGQTMNARRFTRHGNFDKALDAQRMYLDQLLKMKPATETTQ